jgi:hypothetical protein
MRIHLYIDEGTLYEEGEILWGEEYEVPQEVVDRWRSARSEYVKAEDEVHKFMTAQRMKRMEKK